MIDTSMNSLCSSPIDFDLFFPTSKPDIVLGIYEGSQTLPRDLCGVIAEYVISETAFGAKEWMSYLGVDPREGLQEPPLPKHFYFFWFGRDPINPAFRVCEIYTRPILRPKTL